MLVGRGAAFRAATAAAAAVRARAVAEEEVGMAVEAARAGRAGAATGAESLAAPPAA